MKKCLAKNEKWTIWRNEKDSEDVPKEVVTSTEIWRVRIEQVKLDLKTTRQHISNNLFYFIFQIEKERCTWRKRKKLITRNSRYLLAYLWMWYLLASGMCLVWLIPFSLLIFFGKKRRFKGSRWEGVFNSFSFGSNRALYDYSSKTLFVVVMKMTK